MDSPFRPRWVYNDGEAVDYSMTIPQRPWDFDSRGFGGSDTSAAGVPAAFEIRRDYLMHLQLRFPEGEWEDVERLVRHLQRAGSATFYPDQYKVLPLHTVYGISPSITEEIRPTRDAEIGTLGLDITIRRTTEEIFTDCWRPIVVQPTISGAEIEYDARNIVAADLSTVTNWDDETPNDNDALASQGTVRYLETGWDASTAAVEFDQTPQADTMSFTAWGTGGPVTLFAVVETTDLTNGMAIIGTADAINPEVGLYLFVRADGSIVFVNGGNGATGQVTISSAAGVATAGRRMVITARQDGVNGMTLRVNGVEVASTEATITPFPLWYGPRLRQANVSSEGINYTGDDGLIAWLSGYSTAASDTEIKAMEAYLSQAFGA